MRNWKGGCVYNHGETLLDQAMTGWQSILITDVSMPDWNRRGQEVYDFSCLQCLRPEEGPREFGIMKWQFPTKAAAMIRNTNSGWAIDGKLDRVQTLCQRYGVAHLALFGSVVRDDFTAESDIDMLCTLRSDFPARDFQWVAWNRDLADLWERSVDLVKPELLDPRIRDAVLKEARTIYVEAR